MYNKSYRILYVYINSIFQYHLHPFAMSLSNYICGNKPIIETLLKSYDVDGSIS